jgi:iron-sulfur cluster insertion protein
MDIEQKEDLTLSSLAEKRIIHLLSNHKNKDMFLRVHVDSGGCSGFQYHFDFDSKITADTDLKIIKDNTVLAVIDKDSFEFLKGSMIDYIDELGGSFFKITNPNATSTCGCGSSFAV